MTVHEFGKENEQVIVLVHPSIVMWDYFEYFHTLYSERSKTWDMVALRHSTRNYLYEE